MSFFKSEDVKVFPCAYRGTYAGEDGKVYYFNPESIIQSEFNFVNSPNRHWKESYVISYKNDVLKCIINGYYFEISHIDYYLTGTKLNLAIKVADVAISGTSNQTEVLANLDTIPNKKGQTSDQSLDKKDEDDNIYYFTGLAYGLPDTSGYKTLDALTKETNGSWHITYASLLPEIAHDTTENSSVLPGATKITGELTVSDGGATITGATEINGTLTSINTITGKNGLSITNGATNLKATTIAGTTSITGATTIEGATKINTSSEADTTIGNGTGTTTINGGINIPGAIDVSYNSETGILTITRGLEYPAQTN